MKIVLFYAAQTREHLELIRRFERKIMQKGHIVSCVEASEYMGLNYNVDFTESDTIYGFCISGIDDKVKKDMLFLARMLKNEYINKPAFIYSSDKKDFFKLKRQLLKVLKDKNFDVVISKVKECNAIEIDKAVEKLHLVYRKYYQKKIKESRQAFGCDICEVCTNKNE